MHWGPSLRMRILLSCFPNGDERQKRRGDWQSSPCCKRWKTSPTVRPQRWCEGGWIGKMRSRCPWMIQALTPAFWWTFGSACSIMGRRIACSNPFCGSAVNMDAGTAGGKQRTDSTFVLANVRRLSRQDQCGRELESGSGRDRRSGRLSGCWESSARTGLIALCIALSCTAFPKASRRKHSCADRREKRAGIGSQAALDEHAPQQVRDCPSLGPLQQVWNQH